MKRNGTIQYLINTKTRLAIKKIKCQYSYGEKKMLVHIIIFVYSRETYFNLYTQTNQTGIRNNITKLIK